jgi:hypothetical protein
LPLDLYEAIFCSRGCLRGLGAIRRTNVRPIRQ